jgi:type IV pilus assembly protein PilZ
MSKKPAAKGGSKTTKTGSDSGKSSGTIADRNDHRVPIQLLVDYRAGGTYLFDFCKDLGSGGVFIETKQPLSSGSSLDLTFTIPDSKETLSAKGKVIWSQAPIPGRSDVNPGMGVQFSEFNESQRKTLDEFIRRYGGKKNGNSNQRRAG